MLRRVLSPNELKAIVIERASKGLMLNVFTRPSYDPIYDPKLKSGSITIERPTLWIKRLCDSKTKKVNPDIIIVDGVARSTRQRSKERDLTSAEKALTSNTTTPFVVGFII